MNSQVLKVLLAKIILNERELYLSHKQFITFKLKKTSQENKPIFDCTSVLLLVLLYYWFPLNCLTIRILNYASLVFFFSPLF